MNITNIMTTKDYHNQYDFNIEYYSNSKYE